MKRAITLLSLFMAVSAPAQMEVAILAGLRSQQAETNLRQAETAARSASQVGALAFLPISDYGGLRTGLVFVIDPGHDDRVAFLSAAF